MGPARKNLAVKEGWDDGARCSEQRLLASKAATIWSKMTCLAVTMSTRKGGLEGFSTKVFTTTGEPHNQAMSSLRQMAAEDLSC